MIYTELLKAAQLASTREEAQKILNYVAKLGLLRILINNTLSHTLLNEIQ